MNGRKFSEFVAALSAVPVCKQQIADAETKGGQRMKAVPIDLTLEIRSANGVSAEFYQGEEERVVKILRLLQAPRLLNQPLLVLGWEYGISTMPCRMIDIILARTSAPVPLLWPAGVLDITEALPNEWSNVLDEDTATFEPIQNNDHSCPAVTTITSHVEIHTMGGWLIALRLKAQPQATVHDERHSLTHLFELPILAFRLKAGGIGLLNPANITCLRAWPAHNALPNTALPADLVRWNTVFQRQMQPCLQGVSTIKEQQ